MPHQPLTARMGRDHHGWNLLPGTYKNTISLVKIFSFQFFNRPTLVILLELQVLYGIIVLTYTPSNWGTVSLTSPVEATVTSVQSLQYRVSCNYIIRLLWWHHSYQRSQLLRTGTSARTDRVRSASWRRQDWYWDTFWQIMRYTDMIDIYCMH